MSESERSHRREIFEVSCSTEEQCFHITNSSPQRGEEAGLSEQKRTLGVQVRGEINSHSDEQHLHSDTNISRHTEEQHLRSAECWLKTQAVCKTFQPNEDTFNANVVIGKRSIPFHFSNNAILRGLNNCSPQKDGKNCEVYKTRRKAAFTEPSRGMSGAKVEQTSAETLSFRCVCERCRLTRGEVSNKNRKVAFTLAEVLITLGIIGVVAAMTLPTLVANYKKQVMATQAKKAYNVIQNMLNKIQADEGASDIYSSSLFTDGVCSNGREQNCEEQYGNPSKIEKIMTKYLKVIKVCKGDECSISYDVSNYIDNHKFVTSRSWKSTMGTLHGWSTMQGFYTNDGMIIYVIPGGYGVPVLTFGFDTNGEKGPNVEGRDFFFVQKCANGSEYYNFHQNECSSHINLKDTSSPLGYLISNGWKMDY